MPRGKYVNHKGRSRHFTSPEELEQARKAEEAKKKWRDRTNDSDEEEEEEAPESGAETDDDEESSDEDAGEKGAHALIEIENPNRVHKKAVQKVSALNIETTSSLSGGPSKSGGNSGPKPELSRREREEIDKQKAQAAYQKLHSQGKTEQAKADLARLAIIKQQRQEAADRREKERKEKEAKKA